MKKILALLFLCVLLPGLALAESLPTLDHSGLQKLLAANKGKVIMLNFFATWCPPCREEIPDLVKIYKEYKDKDVVIVALSVDDSQKPVLPFVKKMGMQYPVYMAGRDVVAGFRISSIPHNAFYSKDGTLVFSEPGMATHAMIKMVIDELSKE